MSNKHKILVTGSDGFVGRGLVQGLLHSGRFEVRGSVRKSATAAALGGGYVSVGNIEGSTDWSRALLGIDVVIHAAGRAHIMKDSKIDPLSEFRSVNVAGSLNLARQAFRKGVKRFIFISSIKVNGERTSAVKPYKACDSVEPEDSYGVSKFEAEKGLLAIGHQTGMEVVIIRPPLVYGPGVKGNFASMMRLVAKGLPLPLGAVHNKRSLVALDNLVDLIITCIDHPDAVNQVFLAADGEDLSTSELLRRIGVAMERPARLVPVPAGLLHIGAMVMGKKDVAMRLLGSLQVDISKNREMLGWEPPVSVDEGLRRCFSNNQDG